MPLCSTCSSAARAAILSLVVALLSGCASTVIAHPSGSAATIPFSTAVPSTPTSSVPTSSVPTPTAPTPVDPAPAPPVAPAPAPVPPSPTSLSFPEQDGSIAEIPSTYVLGVPNRWVMYFHGYGQDAGTILSGDFGRVEAALLNAGYVVISMTNTVRNCYGNAQCTADVAALANLYKSQLSLESQPFVVADSMGGFTMLNAISSGVLQPRAAVGWSINTDLAWDFDLGGAAFPISADFGISASNPYPLATAGSDPMLQGNTTFAAVPFTLWASYADTVVPRSLNSDRFAARVNRGGANVVVNSSEGEHLDPRNFDPAAVVAFFNAH